MIHIGKKAHIRNIMVCIAVSFVIGMISGMYVAHNADMKMVEVEKIYQEMEMIR